MLILPRFENGRLWLRVHVVDPSLHLWMEEFARGGDVLLEIFTGISRPHFDDDFCSFDMLVWDVIDEVVTSC